MHLRWPGKVPAGKVENGIISGLDWFPTFVAAAGNPNIVEELRRARSSATRTYKVHLDGYNQTGPDHRQGAVRAARDLLLRREHARRGAHRRLQVSLHRPARRLAGRHGQARLADPDQPAPRSVRAHRLAENGIKGGSQNTWIGSSMNSGASCSSSSEVGKLAQTAIEYPADAAGRELQPRCPESGTGEEDGGQAGAVVHRRCSSWTEFWSRWNTGGHGRGCPGHRRLTRTAEGKTWIPAATGAG